MTLPEKYLTGEHSAQFTAYVQHKYSQYGYPKTRPIDFNREFKSKTNSTPLRWVENVTDGLREVGAAHDLARIGHTGWYVDNWQDETTHGVVYQLPARNGAAQYVPAVADPWNSNCALIDFHSVTDDKTDAARWADSMAERYAEDCRESQAKDDQEQRIEEITDEIKTEYQNFRAIAREIRANCEQLKGISVVRELVREKWTATKAAIHKLRAERERIERNGIEYAG